LFVGKNGIIYTYLGCTSASKWHNVPRLTFVAHSKIVAGTKLTRADFEIESLGALMQSKSYKHCPSTAEMPTQNIIDHLSSLVLGAKEFGGPNSDLLHAKRMDRYLWFRRLYELFIFYVLYLVDNMDLFVVSIKFACLP
jgi:hypothetical protein